MINAIIFDLDSCLCAANEVGDPLYAPVFEAIKNANHGNLEADALQAAFSECWRCAFDFVAQKYGFTPDMITAGWDAFKKVAVTTPMRGYDDLPVLKELPVQLFLVTSGFRRLQESKIRALGFAHWFAAIHIDAIDEPERKGKQRLFEEILATHGLRREEVLVVGDNPDSEIEAGNRLGIKTVQILRSGVPRCHNAAHYVNNLIELKELPTTLSPP
jgi:putative hydrolase of the HAD superfamily